MNVHSSEVVSQTFYDLGTENATLRAYVRDLAEHVRGAAAILEVSDMPQSARNFRTVAENALRYLGETHV